MQWDRRPQAGFSTKKLWLPLADDFRHQNVASLDADRGSILHLYKALIALRRSTLQLVSGLIYA
jgi:alpha-glucosidase